MKVLYIEDEPLARWTGKQVIEGLGLDVTPAESCAQAGELWLKNTFDLVISDFRLPDGTADDLIAEMRAAGHNEPVICLSGETEDISAEQRDKLALVAVLGKPLDSGRLQEVVESLNESSDETDDSSAQQISAQTGSDSLHARSASAIQSGPPFWISPFWSINCFGGESWRDIEVIAGQGRDVWIILANCSGAGRESEGLWNKLSFAFKQIARWMPEADSPAEVANRCRLALARDITPDFSIDILVLCLRNGRIMFSGGTGGRWRVFYEKVGEGWRALDDSGDLTGEKETGAVLIAGAGVLRAADMPDSLLAKAGSGEVSIEDFFLLKPEDDCRQFTFQPASNAETMLDIADMLQRAEAALLNAGHHPFHVRRFACALLGLVESGCSLLEISWDTETLRAVPQVRVDAQPESELFFDSTQKNDLSVKFGVEAFSGVPDMPAPGVDDTEADVVTDEKAGRFCLVKMPPLLLKSTVEDIRQKHIGDKWVALDMACVRHVSPQAMASLYKMANERRGSDGTRGSGVQGGFCLISVSALNESIFKYWGMDSHINLIADVRGLDSLARRLTSSSERSSLLK